MALCAGVVAVLLPDDRDATGDILRAVGRSPFGGRLFLAGLVAWATYAQVPGHRSVRYEATFLCRPVEKFTERLVDVNEAMLERHLARSRDRFRP